MSSPTLPFSVLQAPGKPPLLPLSGVDDPADWAAAHRAALRAALLHHGALLVRGLGLRDAAGVGAVFRALAPGGLLPEQESFAPREDRGGGVYSSTKWPANQQMCLHHEMSYTLAFPGTMMFACLTAPDRGGATVTADSPTVLGALPPLLAQRFEREGWMLTRTYGDEIGADWTEAFGTTDRAAVERYCRGNGIEFAWQPDGGLRTRQRRSAIVRHPVTGQWCWFNQVAFLNRWTLADEVREYLVEVYGEDGLPFDTRFGGGDPIGKDVVDLLNGINEAHTAREAWQPGDLMLVDNVRTAHGREAYAGEREVLVGMADPVALDRCSPTVPVPR